MRTPRTEPSAVFALILSIVILLIARGSEASGFPLLPTLAGVCAGAGMVLAAVQIRPKWFAREERRSARVKCDEIRDTLMAELSALEEMERPVRPIRMRSSDEEEAIPLREAA